jgi:hypothetical protein
MNIHALCLTACLSLATLAHAGPPALSQDEQRCAALGRFTLTRALERDDGISLLETLQRAREYDAARGTSRAIREVHDFLIRHVYAFPERSPAQLQQETEVVCVAQIGQPGPTDPRTQQRY